MTTPTTFRVLGLMAGSSMDGLDCALCDFWNDGTWHYRIVKAQTVDYPEGWADWLGTLNKGAAQYLMEADRKYGQWIAETAAKFLGEDRCELIGLHGHTVMHQADKGVSAQLGNPAALYAKLMIPVVTDFRSLDLALGGQGAPLIPVVDELLFNHYGACLNLGGIANVSLTQNAQRVGYDVCACNQLLDEVAHQQGMRYDEGGQLAGQGRVIPRLLDRLNNWKFLSTTGPKSLGTEHIVVDLLPLLRHRKEPAADLLYTCCVHIAQQIARSLAGVEGKVLVSGGGTHNKTLTQLIENEGVPVVLAEPILIDFKEAMGFGLLALRRALGETTSLPSVTGARSASSGGQITGGRIIFL